jgi:diguanylate cyclase (GGDEF)-like protein
LHRVQLGFLAVLMALASAPSALAQSPPQSGGVSAASVSPSVVTLSQGGISISTNGITVDVTPQQGATVDVDAGDAGSVSVGAGPQGVTLDLSDSPVQLPTTESGSGTQSPQRSGGASGSQPSSGGGRAPRLQTGPAEDDGSAGTQDTAGSRSTPASTGAAAPSARRGPERSAADRRVDPKPTAAREESRGVAPFLDFIEEIPRAVWAGLIALALIALAMWLMWVRGRRRLEKNAYVDADSGITNAAAFETLLAGEWTRAVRYQRPLGLLLLELADVSRADGLLGGRRLQAARDAIQDSVREADTVAQLSGSRFAVITPEAAHGSVQTLARAVEHSLELAGTRVSVGIGDRRETDRGPADLVARAAASLGNVPQPGAGEDVEPPTEDVRRPSLHVAA